TVHLPAPVREPRRGAPDHRRVHHALQHRVADRAPGPSDAGAGTGRRAAEGRLTMRPGSTPTTEGRRRSPRRLEEGGRYLGIPGSGDFGTSPDEGERADDRHSVLTQCPGNRVRYILTMLSLRGWLFLIVSLAFLIFLYGNLTFATRTAAPDVYWEL